MNNFDKYLKNPYWKKYYDNAPTENVKNYIEHEFKALDYINKPLEESKKYGEEGRDLLKKLNNDELEYLISYCKNNQWKAELKKYLH